MARKSCPKVFCLVCANVCQADCDSQWFTSTAPRRGRPQRERLTSWATRPAKSRTKWLVHLSCSCVGGVLAIKCHCACHQAEDVKHGLFRRYWNGLMQESKGTKAFVAIVTAVNVLGGLLYSDKVRELPG